MEDHIKRRRLLRSLAVLNTVTLAGCDSRSVDPNLWTSQPGSDTAEGDNQHQSYQSTFDEFQRAGSVDELQSPGSYPAIALTDSGWYERVEESDDWCSISLGTEANPYPAAHFQRLDAEVVNNVHIANPEEVQAKIDAVAAGDFGGTVKLRSGVDYAPTQTWQVKRGVTLDCNGAELVPETDRDLFFIHPTAQVVDPVVDLTDFRFTSRVFTFDPSFDGNYFSDGTTVRGGKTIATEGTGTLFDFHVAGDGHIALIDVNHRLSRPKSKTVDTAINLQNTGSGFINGNIIRGEYRAPNTGISQRGTGLINNNYYHVHLQPWENSSGSGWHIQTGSRNVFQGMIWDPQKWSEGAWNLERGAGDGNVLMTNVGPISENVRDNSNMNNNRVIVPKFIEADRTGVALGPNAASTAPDSVALGRDASVPRGTPRGGHINVDGLAFGAVRGTWSADSLSSSEITFELDEANDRIVITAKYSDGSTVKRGSVPLE